MKWFRKIGKEKEQEQEILQIEEKKQEQEIDFTDSMFEDIAEMKLRLENIKSEEEIYEELKSLIDSFEKYIEKSSEIIEERKIEDKLRRINESNIILKLETSPQIPQSLKDRANQELTIEEYYKNIKSVYEVKYKRATQSILMKKAEKFNGDMDKLLFGQVDFDTISTIDVAELKTYYGILKQKNEEFTGIMQNKYVEKLIEMQYKINIIDIIKSKCCFPNGSLKEDIRKLVKESQTSKSKQAIWARLFINGIENLVGRANNSYVQYLKRDIPKINLKDNTEEILNEFIIDTYVKGIAQIHIDKKEEKKRQEAQEKEEQEKLEREQEEKEKQDRLKREQEEKQKELEKMAKISESEIEEKIKELDDDKFDIVTSYNSIMDFQLKVAEAKGLINDRNILAIDDIQIIRLERRRIPLIFARLKEEISNYEIYTDIDNSSDNVYVVTSKSNTYNFNGNTDYTNNYEDYVKYITATNEFISTYLICSNKNRYITRVSYGLNKYNGSMYFYKGREEEVKEDIKNLVKQYKDENNKNSKKVKFYIEVPYRRTIIPILEELQQNKIEFVIPPTDKDTKMNEPTVRIYMDRSDLERYKENVHGNISTSDKGIVKIGEEKINIDEILIEGCEFSFLKNKEKEEKQ